MVELVVLLVACRGIVVLVSHALEARPTALLILGVGRVKFTLALSFAVLFPTFALTFSILILAFACSLSGLGPAC